MYQQANDLTPDATLIILMFCRVVTVLVFALSFVGKVRVLTTLEKTISQFDIIPQRLSKLTAWLVLVLELVIVLLVSGGGQLLAPGFLLASVALAAFTFALVSAITRRIDVSCNCFGATQEKVSPANIVRNTGFLACTLGGLVIALGPASQQATHARLGLTELIFVGIASTLFVAVWLHLDEMARLFRQER
jgi:hypothetical protein